MGALEEFREAAGEIMSEITPWSSTNDLVRLTKQMYELKARFFPLITLHEICDNNLMKDEYCPLCRRFIHSDVSCPLVGKVCYGACCDEWRVIRRLLNTENRELWDERFQALKDVIDKL